jgi:eukaryotic-like serine/threonine-protein kinase
VLRGRQLGDFVLRECIGEGAFAAVYRCEQPLLGREAVIKVLHQRLRTSEVVFQRFMREARLASRLDHPYAAHVYAFGVEPDDGLAWIAMELVHGTSLARWLSERGAMPLDMLVAFFEQVAEIVQNAHDHGIVHRDLKPSNVMIIEYAGKIFPKLLDFGIAKLVDDAANAGMSSGEFSPPTHPGAAIPNGLVTGEFDDTLSPMAMGSGDIQLTQANATLGSPPYMSPEQWCDPLSVGPRSDLYALGVMAYEALTGHQPFIGPTIAAIGEQHCNAEVPPVGEAFPPAMDRVFRRALAKDPEDRPASALDFARELRAAALAPPRSDTGIPTATMAPIARWRMRSVAVGAAAAIVGGVVAYVCALKLLASDGSPPARQDIAAIPTSAITATPQPAAPGVLATAAAEAPAGPANATVVVEIESTPHGAEVFRLPSETRVGVTPWRMAVPREEGTQTFLIRKPGFAERRVVIDLRTGGTRAVQLPRVAYRPPHPPPGAPRTEPARKEGEPVDPFRNGGK